MSKVKKLKQVADQAESKQGKRKPLPQWFKPGQSGNPKGRPKGVKTFGTLFKEAIKKIAKEKHIKKSQVEVDLVIRAIAEAKGGNFNYYKDIFDRVYGKSKEQVDLVLKGKDLKDIQTGVKEIIEMVKKQEREDDE